MLYHFGTELQLPHPHKIGHDWKSGLHLFSNSKHIFLHAAQVKFLPTRSLVTLNGADFLLAILRSEALNSVVSIWATTAIKACRVNPRIPVILLYMGKKKLYSYADVTSRVLKS